MDTKVWFDGCTIISVALLFLAWLLVIGSDILGWRPEELFILAAAFFVARDYQW